MRIAPPPAVDALPRRRVRLTVRGTVQGVGFRPFVYRVARDLGISGSVANTTAGVTIEAEGSPDAVVRFVGAIRAGPPPPARVAAVDEEAIAPVGDAAFEIGPSIEGAARSATVLPDLSTCAACLRELFDPADHRYRYPFTNCTHCGPRYSIVEDLPYDRARTSMKRFPMCGACASEYADPSDRRFHAEPNACPACGPQLALWDGEGRVLANGEAALAAAAGAVRAGAIVALKGLGGFHLVVDARNEAAVRRLRARKSREEKPFAVMFPSLAAIEAECDLRPEEAALLTAPERPIVIVRRRPEAMGFDVAPDASTGRDSRVVETKARRRTRPAPPPERGRVGGGRRHTEPGALEAQRQSAGAVHGGTDPLLSSPFQGEGLARPLASGAAPISHTSLAPSVAPGNPTVGALLPYTPLHHLLMVELGFPIVATSGNRSEEPIVIDEHDAVARLAGIADLFLVHDRPIVRPVDDSVARVVSGRPMLIRRARGYAPAPAIEADMPPGILAFGGHLKATVALTLGAGVLLSQHIGDLATAEARDTYDRTITDLARLHGASARIAVHDLHPDYHSTHAAAASGLPTVAVQHHLAHVAAGMAEHRLPPPVLGVAFDGTGYGPDGTVWGGEFLLVSETGWRRVAHLRPFRLPGGEAAVREPRRSALGLLYELFGPASLAMTDLAPIAAFSAAERRVLATMLARGVNAPITTSAGRLFDAVAALLGLRQRSSYEGQAAMQLEWAVGDPLEAHPNAYPFAVTPADPMVVDWEPAIRALVADLRAGVPVAAISTAFHRGLAAAIADVAGRLGEKRVVLTGGCFQNAFLTEAAIDALSILGIVPYWHHLVPPNDGGLALGQAAWAASLIERGEIRCA